MPAACYGVFDCEKGKENHMSEMESKNFIEQIIDKDLAEGAMPYTRAFLQNQTDICILVMQRVFC